MHRLTDARAVLAFAERTLDVTAFDQVADVVLPGLAEVVGADSATLSHLDLGTGREAVSRWPLPNPGRLDSYAALAAGHPLRPVVDAQTRATTRRPDPVRISDVLGLRGWRGSPLRTEALPDVDDQLTVATGRRSTAVHVVGLGRRSGTFTDRQADLLAACWSHLDAALRRLRVDEHHHCLQVTPTVRWVPATQAPGRSRAVPGPLVPPGPGLSPREAQVAELVARGLTDAQIARRLSVRPATVSKHLGRVYARLGLANRAALATHWLERSSRPAPVVR